MTILINILLVLESIVALLMMFVILMQRPKSEGLGAAFGGGVTENIFGAQTTNVLTTATTWLASIFFILVLTLSVLYAHRGSSGSAVRRELEKSSATAPLPAKDAAKAAAADAKAKVVPTAAPAGGTETTASPAPAATNTGAAPGVPNNGASATPAGSAQPSP
jgi:preprotein translocase subunit SecG